MMGMMTAKTLIGNILLLLWVFQVELQRSARIVISISGVLKLEKVHGLPRKIGKSLIWFRFMVRTRRPLVLQ